jgi:chromosome segregation ATPase
MTNGHRQRRSDGSQEQADSVDDARASDFGRGLDRSSAYSGASSTLVEQLRQENEELRREVGAQASMLTSRNREKERLYQEIEDLKLGQMRGEGMRPSGADSMFDRSGSRARPRSGSATSGLTRVTVVSDTERDTYERRYGRLRDELSQLRLQNRELEMKLEECLDEVEQVEVAKARREKELEEELDIVTRDLQAVHGERDEVMMLRDELETEYENLKQEAQQEINNLEADLEHKAEEIRQLRRDLSNRNESFSALQGEMRSLSEVVVRLEDDQRSSSRQILNLQQELHVAHTELDVLDRNLREANAKVERYTVQQESSQGEIAFLREEQDADKMKIGDLETALKNARNSLQEESDRLRELHRRTDSERRQRDILISRERQEHQKAVADVKRELSGCEDELREIKKSLSAKESEAKEWKESAEELEDNLREALGDPGATRASILRVSLSLL